MKNFYEKPAISDAKQFLKQIYFIGTQEFFIFRNSFINEMRVLSPKTFAICEQLAEESTKYYEFIAFLIKNFPL